MVEEIVLDGRLVPVGVGLIESVELVWELQLLALFCVWK